MEPKRLVAVDSPVDWLSARQRECRIRPRKWSRAKEPSRGRQRAGVHRLDHRRSVRCAAVARAIQQRSERASIRTPQQGHEWSTTLCKCAHRDLGHRLPPDPPVRARHTRAHREHPVEHHDSPIGPCREVTVRGGRNPHVVFELAVHVAQTPWQRSHVAVYRKRQADRMPHARVRVLPNNEHPHLAERPTEYPHDVCRGRKVAPPARRFRVEKSPNALQRRLRWL